MCVVCRLHWYDCTLRQWLSSESTDANGSRPGPSESVGVANCCKTVMSQLPVSILQFFAADATNHKFDVNIHASSSIVVTDVAGNILKDCSFLDEGSSIWIPIYINGSYHLPESALNNEHKTVTLGEHSHFILELSVRGALSYCNVSASQVVGHKYREMLDLVRHIFKNQIQATLQNMWYSNEVLRVEKQLEDTEHFVNIFNKCIHELSDQGGRVSGVSPAIENYLQQYSGISSVGIVCVDSLDGSILYNTFSANYKNVRRRESPSRTKQRTTSQDDNSLFEDRLDGGKSLRSTNALDSYLDEALNNVYHSMDGRASGMDEKSKQQAVARYFSSQFAISNGELSQTYANYFHNHRYAAVDFQCYDITGRFIVFGDIVEQHTNSTAAVTSIPSWDTIVCKNKVDQLSSLNLPTPMNEVISSVSKSYARRIHELRRGQKNKQLILTKTEELSVCG